MTRTWRECAQAMRKQSASRSLVFMWKCDRRLIPPGHRQRQARGHRGEKCVRARLVACIQSCQDERHGGRCYLNQARSVGRCERATLAFASIEHTGNGFKHKDTLHTFSCACMQYPPQGREGWTASVQDKRKWLAERLVHKNILALHLIRYQSLFFRCALRGRFYVRSTGNRA